MAKSRQSLAQGLSASIAQKFIANPDSVQSAQTLPLQQIQLPKQQPRRYFDSEKQAQLVKSVQEHGILEPLLVRPLGVAMNWLQVNGAIEQLRKLDCRKFQSLFETLTIAKRSKLLLLRTFRERT